MEKNEQMLDLLLATGSIEIDLRTRQGDTALCLALLIEPSFESGAEKLLSRGATPNPRYPGDEADSLLHKLARDSREDAALFLLEPLEGEGDNVTTKKKYRTDSESLEARNREGWTVLHEAARSGLSNLCQRLLERLPTLLNGRTLVGDTAIHLAVGHGKLQALRALLDAAPDDDVRKELLTSKNKDAETPLSLALGAVIKDKDVLRALINAGADLEQRNESGHTALHQAILKEDSASAIFLLENGADMNAK